MDRYEADKHVVEGHCPINSGAFQERCPIVFELGRYLTGRDRRVGNEVPFVAVGQQRAVGSVIAVVQLRADRVAQLTEWEIQTLRPTRNRTSGD